MAKDAIVSQELADKFKTEKDSPYLRFVRGEGLDIISAQYVPNLRTVGLKPWPRADTNRKRWFPRRRRLKCKSNAARRKRLPLIGSERQSAKRNSDP